jgi:25S rRNA (adenine2142-N1)-methyltransferase
MGTKRVRKKIPLTSTTTRIPSGHKATQATISTFHTLIKQQSRLKRQLSATHVDEQRAALISELEAIDEKIDSLGGLASYQDASKLGQSAERGGDSAKVLISWLRREGVHHRRYRPMPKPRSLQTP